MVYVESHAAVLRQFSPTEDPRGEMGYLMLDRENCDGGVFHYQGAGPDRPERDEIEGWGMPPIVYALERVCRKWAEAGHPTIQIGDMTRPQGGTYWRLTDEEYQDDGHEDTVTGNYVEATDPDQLQKERPDGNSYRMDHSSHKRGWVADIRPMVGSEEEVGNGLTVDSEAYDQKLSHKFLKTLQSEAPHNRGRSMLSYVLFGDDRLTSKKSPLYLDFVVRNSSCRDHYHLVFIILNSKYD